MIRKTKEKNVEPLEIKEKYVYNETSDTYITPLKSRVKPLVLSGAKHRAIIKSLSSFISTGSTTEEVAAKYGIPIIYLEEYKKIHGITRDSLPLSVEEIDNQDTEQTAKQLLEEKKLELLQKFEKADWKVTQTKADRWDEFQAKELDPFQLAMENWIPPKSKSNVKFPKSSQEYKNVLLIALSDLHWGSKANQHYMYNHKGGWDSNKTTQVVDNYCKSVLESIKDRTYKFKKIAFVFGGDFLHSVSGKTSRGTELKYDLIREDLFEIAMTGITRFLENFVALFEDIEVHTVGGNHNYEAETALYRALAAYFRTNTNIKFFNYTTRPASFRIENTLFLLDHGQDSEVKALVPLNESKLEAHVQNLLLYKPELLIGINSKVFMMNDRHNFRHTEFDNFDFVMFSTCVGADEYANANNWSNRARQNCLVIDEHGIKEVHHFYTDALIPQ